VAETFRFTRDKFHRLGEAGIPRDDVRLELLDGKLIVMPPVGNRHILAVRKLNRIFDHTFGDRCAVDVQSPIVLDDYSEPLPDVLLVDVELDRDVRAPTPAEVFLLVEVAASSLDFDREYKLARYAEAGIREVWIVNLNDSVIEVYRNPSETRYRDTNTVRHGERLAVAAFPETTFALEELLPEEE
jgi:Uma2 family endonuclease